MEAAGMDKGKDEKLHTDASVQQGQRRRRGRRLILSLVLALMIVLLSHGAWRKTWPRIQGIEYEDANGDLVYGLRIYAPDVTTEGGVPRDWLIEVGKIPDDGLRDRQLSSYVGLADSWLYFRVTSGDDTHFLLASLWLVSDRVAILRLVKRFLCCFIKYAGKPSTQGGGGSDPTQGPKPSRISQDAHHSQATIIGNPHGGILGRDAGRTL
jgi:hypothetical protein